MQIVEKLGDKVSNFQSLNPLWLYCITYRLVCDRNWRVRLHKIETKHFERESIDSGIYLRDLNGTTGGQ